MTLPTFLTVGAEKCGTTALHVHLSHHPQVFMSEPKEPSFFVADDQRFVRQDMGGNSHPYSRTLSEYEALFAATEGATAIGESSPCYLYSDVAPHRIKAQIPEARIIAMLRNPMQRAYSQFVFNQQRGWESLKLTFAEALALEEERVAKNSMWAFHYTRRGLYAPQIERYLDVFGADRVLVVLHDDFSREPERVLDGIHEFLGVDRIVVDDVRERHNVTGLPKNRLLHRMIHTPNPLKSILKSILPRGVRERILRPIRAWNSVKPEADPNDMARLRDVFEADIRRLAGSIEPDPMVWLNE